MMTQEWVQRGGFCLPFCLKIRPFFLAGLGFAVFFSLEEYLFLCCFCDFGMGEHVQLSFQDKTRTLYMSCD